MLNGLEVLPLTRSWNLISFCLGLDFGYIVASSIRVQRWLGFNPGSLNKVRRCIGTRDSAFISLFNGILVLRSCQDRFFEQFYITLHRCQTSLFFESVLGGLQKQGESPSGHLYFGVSMDIKSNMRSRDHNFNWSRNLQIAYPHYIFISTECQLQGWWNQTSWGGEWILDDRYSCRQEPLTSWRPLSLPVYFLPISTPPLVSIG